MTFAVLIRTLIAASLVLALSSAYTNGATAGQSCDGEVYELGSQIQAIYAAISSPESPAAMETITRLGTDSRYYTMVRGWLAMQLAGDRSILDSTGIEQNPAIAARVTFLEKAIRAIDLE